MTPAPLCPRGINTQDIISKVHASHVRGFKYRKDTGFVSRAGCLPFMVPMYDTLSFRVRTDTSTVLSYRADGFKVIIFLLPRPQRESQLLKRYCTSANVSMSSHGTT